jgi:hypothetical protein
VKLVVAFLDAPGCLGRLLVLVKSTFATFSSIRFKPQTASYPVRRWVGGAMPQYHASAGCTGPLGGPKP